MARKKLPPLIVFVEHKGVTVWIMWRWCGRIWRTENFALTPAAALSEVNDTCGMHYADTFRPDCFPPEILAGIDLDPCAGTDEPLYVAFKRAMEARKTVIRRAIDAGFDLRSAKLEPIAGPALPSQMIGPIDDDEIPF